MSKDVVATSTNIDNITKMLTLLQTVKEDSGKLREISLDDTGWEGMDATAFNESLKTFANKLDETSEQIESALSTYKSKQEQQLSESARLENVAKYLIEGGLEEYNANPFMPWSPEVVEMAKKLNEQKNNNQQGKNNEEESDVQIDQPKNATPSNATPSNATPSNASEHADPEKKTLH